MTKAIRWTEQMLLDHQRRGEKSLAKVPIPTSGSSPAMPKYRNVAVDIDGEKFDSKREAHRWRQLQQMQTAGEIDGLRRQVKYELIPKQQRQDGTTERACTYVCDFRYMRAGLIVVEDAKGMRTRDYIIKRKLMLYVHGLTVVEV